MGLLAIIFFFLAFVCMKKSLFYPCFRKAFSLCRKFQVDNFFFQYFKDTAPLSFCLHYFVWEICYNLYTFFLHVMCLPLHSPWLLLRLCLYYWFRTIWLWHVLVCFLHISYVSVFLSFLELWVYSFFKKPSLVTFWLFSFQTLFSCPPTLCFPLETLITHRRSCLKLSPQCTFALYIFKILFFSMCFFLDSLYYYVFKFLILFWKIGEGGGNKILSAVIGFYPVYFSSEKDKITTHLI